MNSHLIVRDLVKKTEECVNIPEHGQLPNGSSYTSFCMTKSLHCPSSSCCSSFTSHFVAPIPLFFLLPVVLSTSFSPSRKFIELSLLFSRRLLTMLSSLSRDVCLFVDEEGRRDRQTKKGRRRKVSGLGIRDTQEGVFSLTKSCPSLDVLRHPSSSSLVRQQHPYQRRR